MRPFRTAEIIAVGSELLTPFRADTNSLVLTTRLNDLGIIVAGKAIVGDDVEMLAALVRLALARVDLVVTTGGLGPTEDDVTREAVARALTLAMHEDLALVRAIEARFARRGLAMPASNRRQAMVPEGASVLVNPAGTAPGLWIDAGEQAVILLPGPPREMRAILDGDLRPRLSARSEGHRVERRVISTTGRPESAVDEVVAPIYGPWRAGPMPIATTILAANGQIELHLSATSDGTGAARKRLDAAVGTLAGALGDIVFSVDGQPLEAVVGRGLRARGWRIAAAESCTGGGLLSRLTDIPGSSAYVIGGVVAYDNTVKVADLGVPASTLETHGAVSEPVALAMAEGVRVRLSADVGVAITGIAGPDGGSAEKPVGTVVIAIAVIGRAPAVRTYLFLGDRAMIRTQSVVAALDLVRRALSSANS
jgi:nicotinamide-nucleotide amidase